MFFNEFFAVNVPNLEGRMLAMHTILYMKLQLSMVLRFGFEIRAFFRSQ